MTSTRIYNKMIFKDSMKIGIMLQIDQDSKLSQINWNMAMNPIKTGIKTMDIITKEVKVYKTELKLEDLVTFTNKTEVISFQLMHEVRISL